VNVDAVKSRAGFSPPTGRRILVPTGDLGRNGPERGGLKPALLQGQQAVFWRQVGLILAIAVAAFVPARGADGNPEKTRELVRVLEAGGMALADKARACQQLAIVGTSEAIPALAAKLNDEYLAHYAREALEAMASTAADAALRESVSRLRGAQLVGVVNSLGMRRDVASVPALAKLARDANSPAAPAALLALGRIGTTEAGDVVRTTLTGGLDAQRGGAAEGALLLGDRALKAGERNGAIAWYDAVRAAPVATQLKLSALRGAILARQNEGVPLVLESLRSSDLQARAVALRAIRELEGADVVVAIAKAVETLPAPMQAQVIAALVDRGDERALPLFERQLSAREEVVRIAALRALGQAGRDSSVPSLLKALGGDGSAAEREAAARSLVQIKSKAADSALLDALQKHTGAQRVKVVGIIGERGNAAATPAIIALARDIDPAMSQAALRTLALIARPADLPQLIELSVAARSDEARAQADRAIYATSMKILEPERRVEPLLGAFRESKTPAARSALLRPIGVVVRAMGGNDEALRIVTTAARDSDVVVRDAAVATLAGWPGAKAAPVLLDYVQREPNGAQRAVAFGGVARMAADVAAGRDATSLDPLATFTQLNALAQADDERMKVISGLGNVKRIEAFRLLVPYLDNPAFKTETALAMVQIAPALTRRADAEIVRTSLQRIARDEKDPDVRARAARLLSGELPAPKKGKKA
jgi:HEAT repeat protein